MSTNRTSRTGQKVDGRIEFRPPRALWLITVGAFLVVLGFTFVAFVVQLAWWYRLGYVLVSSLFVFAFLELALGHVTLYDDRLSFHRSFRSRAIPRPEIESVTWAGGAGVSLRLTNGQWVRLPEVGPSSQGLTNSIRAWLKRTGTAQA